MVKNNKDTIDKIKKSQTLTDDEKSTLLGLLEKRKRYGLVWEDKPEDVEEELKTKVPVLKEVKERAIVNDTEIEHFPNHVLIEGDNLHAEVVLDYVMPGSVDIVYIDPPYNRGDKDFMYNDKYIDKENPYRHSMWLSFMSKRLKIAKKLLSDQGVLIIHIDEHEFDALNMLLENDIFKRENNLGLIVWNKMNPKGDAHNVAVMHEYILVYCKNKEIFTSIPDSLMRDKPHAEQIVLKGKNIIKKLHKKVVPEEIKSVLKAYGFDKNEINRYEIDYTFQRIISEFQKWLSKSDFSKGEKAYKYLDKEGRVFRTVSMAWPNKEKAPEDYWIPLIHPITKELCPLPSRGWRNPSETMHQLLGNNPPIIYSENMIIQGEIAFTRKKNGELNIPERIYYLEENMKENVPSIYNDGSSDDKLLADMKISFPYPKTLSVAKYLLKNILPSANIILDFFAGSGTTLHATMQLNEEDGGHRQCILVTNNENHICEEVTYERNKKVIEGYTTPKGEFVEGLHHNNLRYYKTDFVPRERTMKNMRALVSKATDMLCIKEDLYQEVPEFGKLKLPKPIVRHFTNGTREMLIIYREESIGELVGEIRDMDFKEKLKVYVFSPDRDPFEDEFEEVEEKVQTCALPAAIYDAYVHALPKRKDKLVEIAPESEEDYEEEEWDMNEEGEV